MEAWVLWGIVGILLFSFLLFFLLSRRRSYRRLNHESVSHYVAERDDLSREEEEEDIEDEDATQEEEEPGNHFSVLSIIISLGFVVLTFVVASTILGSLGSLNNITSSNSNLTSSPFAAVGSFLPTIATVMVVVIIISLLFFGFSSFFTSSGEEPEAGDRSNRHKAVKHYTRMRDELTHTSKRQSYERKKKRKG